MTRLSNLHKLSLGLCEDVYNEEERKFKFWGSDLLFSALLHIFPLLPPLSLSLEFRFLLSSFLFSPLGLSKHQTPTSFFVTPASGKCSGGSSFFFACFLLFSIHLLCDVTWSSSASFFTAACAMSSGLSKLSVSLFLSTVSFILDICELQ